MAVRAYKIISASGTPYRIEYTFECGQFDLMQANGAAWTEIWRDCDIAGKLRRSLYPFAAGLLSAADVKVDISGQKLRHRKYFATTDDTVRTALSLSDVNGGVLPLDICTYIDVYQNGKKIPCEGFSINHSTSTITIAAAWAVPGASYEVLFWASPMS